MATLSVAGSAAHAQTPPATPDAADLAMAAQKAAFLGLPEATRTAVQDALVWLGLYNGVADGDFGKRTRAAIVAFQSSMKAPADGMLSAAELQALLAALRRARDAVGFQVVGDPKTGASERQIRRPPLALGLIRALDVRECEIAAARLTKTSAFRQMVRKTLEVRKPARCLMTEVFTRDACDLEKGPSLENCGSSRCRLSDLGVCCAAAAATSP